MRNGNYGSPLLHSISTIILILITSSTSFCDEHELYSNCRTSFSCGENSPKITYPFWGGKMFPECGLPGFELKCQQDDHLTIDIGSQTFRVLSIDGSKPTLTIARDDLWDIDICPETYQYTSINPSPFRFGPKVETIILFYGCEDDVYIPAKNKFSCSINDNKINGFWWDASISASCQWIISVPVLERGFEEFKSSASLSLQGLLNQGFSLDYTIDSTACSACASSGGLCWSGTNSTSPTCLCSDGTKKLICSHRGEGLNLPLKIGIGFGAAAGGALIVCIIFFVYQRRHRKPQSGSFLNSRDISSYVSSVSDPEKASGYLGVHIFAYSELEEATNNFDSARELGDGGFGTVYKGKLRDGRDVAVKRLYENNFKRVEQFRNEVEILTRLRHRNLVSLYGSTSRHCRELLLVYEYIPNGTVADHIHGSLTRPGSLPWSTRMNIAIETASALSYLHASDVIHRDVKTNNILLDNNFCVKVADFGLSRLFPINATHISTAPQGTPGYVDPEYHQCYHLTDKSDVYSFGVVLIELISSMPAVDITRHRHEINLSNMAVNRIQNHLLHELVDPCLGFDSDYKIRAMIEDVAELAFQCLQYGRDMRPSMQEVLKALLEIQSKDYNAGKKEETDIPADDIVLLKTNNLTSSPDSVITDLVSSTTTPSTSN